VKPTENEEPKDETLQDTPYSTSAFRSSFNVGEYEEDSATDTAAQDNARTSPKLVCDLQRSTAEEVQLQTLSPLK
jgi:hypothetical protein